MTTCSNFTFALTAGSKTTEVTIAFGQMVNAWQAGRDFFARNTGVPTWNGTDLGLAGIAGMQGVIHLPQDIDHVPLHATGELDVMYTPTRDGHYVPTKGTWELVSKH